MCKRIVLWCGVASIVCLQNSWMYASDDKSVIDDKKKLFVPKTRSRSGSVSETPTHLTKDSHGHEPKTGSASSSRAPSPHRPTIREESKHTSPKTHHVDHHDDQHKIAGHIPPQEGVHLGDLANQVMQLKHEVSALQQKYADLNTELTVIQKGQMHEHQNKGYVDEHLKQAIESHNRSAHGVSDDSVTKLTAYCEQLKESLDNRILDIARIEKNQTEHMKAMAALVQKVAALETNAKTHNRAAIGVGLDQENPEDQEEPVAIKIVQEKLENKHAELSDAIIKAVEEQAKNVTACQTGITQLNTELRAIKTKQASVLKQPSAAAQPWHRLLLNLGTASSLLVSGLYYGRGALPLVAKVIAGSSWRAAALAVPYLYVPAAGLFTASVVADFYADFQAKQFEANKKLWHTYFQHARIWRTNVEPTSFFMGSAIICKALINNCFAVGKTITKMLFAASAVNMLIAVGVGAAVAASHA